ncbi:CvpA family protein [Agathobaculum sp.]|uniref:CvpA family protein n=1 Tax=Agathobaculum sp. TaxID=2048138 RepID=UPI002A7EE9AE|nr:CvpA family protein [Agathobaculum sp.]MDY3617649.1 CvpA family protein [Agathobaculum sp.]
MTLNEPITDLLPKLLNLPDLMILAVLLVNLILGFRRGALHSLTGMVGKIAALAAASFTAKALAPGLARLVVTPIVGEVFSKQAELGAASGLLDGLKQTVTEAAASMAESIAFLALLLLFAVLFGWLAAILGKSLHFLAHLTPLGVLDSLGGAAIGAVCGLLLICLILIGIEWFSPITYSALGCLSPERVESTVLLKALIDLLPVAI